MLIYHRGVVIPQGVSIYHPTIYTGSVVYLVFVAWQPCLLLIDVMTIDSLVVATMLKKMILVAR